MENIRRIWGHAQDKNWGKGGLGRSCEGAFTLHWPCEEKRIQDGGMGVGSGAGNQQAYHKSGGEKASKNSNIQKKVPERMSQQDFWERLNPLGSDVNLAKVFVISFLDCCREPPSWSPYHPFLLPFMYLPPSHHLTRDQKVPGSSP